jgi:hypothetical protein
MTNLHVRTALPPTSPFRRIFVPWRLFAGLGVVVVGILILVAIFLFAERIKISTLLAGPGAIVLGIAMMVSAWAKGCTACKTPLAETSVVFPLDATPHVRQAVDWVAHGSVEALLHLHHAPLATAPRMSAVLVSFCPGCRNVAEIATATTARLADGATTHENVSPKVPLTGPGVGRVLEMIGVRNAAMTTAIYGGALPR